MTLRFHPIHAAVVLSAALPASPAPAQPPRGLPVAPVAVDETYRERVLISSTGALVGLVAEGNGPALPRGQLWVLLPAAPGDSLCVSIRSRDGRYDGSYRYDRRRVAGDRVLLDVRSPRYGERTASYAPDELAVLASVGDGCATGERTFLVASRRTLPRAADVRVLLSADAGMIVAAALPGGAETRCPPLEVDLALAFNRVCTVHLPARPGTYRLAVRLASPGEDAAPETYPLGVP